MQVATSNVKNIYWMNTHTSVHIHKGLKATCQYLSSFQFFLHLPVVQSSAMPRQTGFYMCMRKDQTCRMGRDELMWWGCNEAVFYLQKLPGTREGTCSSLKKYLLGLLKHQLHQRFGGVVERQFLDSSS